jgi:arsenate reductase (glutaredoxin)
MITIYHNTHCAKSRDGVNFLQNLELEFQTIDYLENNLTIEELKVIIKKLNIPLIDAIRTNTREWIEHYIDKNLSDEEIYAVVAKDQTLLNCPIVANNEKAVIARPVEKIMEIL